RAIHDVVSPPAHLGGLGLRRLLAAGSPFGAPGGPLRSRLRRPSPRRLLDALYDGPDGCPLDSVGFDGGGPAALAAWCRDQPVLTPGLPLWAVGDGAAADLAAVVDAVEAGTPVGAYLCRGLPSSEAFGRLVAGLRSGDRSVLAGP
ncbi:MAG TPA: hypothetical protein VHW47_01075, partial [Acidimicrobiales bacterium]|nr:hypothetical protein [Acidimicrobiales bacterium]